MKPIYADYLRNACTNLPYPSRNQFKNGEIFRVSFVNEPIHPQSWFEPGKQDINETKQLTTLLFKFETWSFKFKSGEIDHDDKWIFVGVE